jgi:hypothetical protein
VSHRTQASSRPANDAALEAVAKEANPYGRMEEWEIMAEGREAAALRRQLPISRGTSSSL